MGFNGDDYVLNLNLVAGSDERDVDYMSSLQIHLETDSVSPESGIERKCQWPASSLRKLACAFY